MQMLAPRSHFVDGGSLLQRRESAPAVVSVPANPAFVHDFTTVRATGVLQRQKDDPPKHKTKPKTKPKPKTKTKTKPKTKVKQLADVPAEGECRQTIGSEGSCAFLAKSTPSCCDPDNGIFVETKAENSKGVVCPSKKWTPAFACDNNCETAIKAGCKASDKYLAIPSTIPDRKKHCGETYTVCAKGKQTTAVIRDTADKRTNPGHFEASPAVFSALGLNVADSFAGKVYGPGTEVSVIAQNTCCNPAAKQAPKDGPP